MKSTKELLEDHKEKLEWAIKYYTRVLHTMHNVSWFDHDHIIGRIEERTLDLKSANDCIHNIQ